LESFDDGAVADSAKLDLDGGLKTIRKIQLAIFGMFIPGLDMEGEA
jgi:hypothetical protein